MVFKYLDIGEVCGNSALSVSGWLEIADVQRAIAHLNACAALTENEVAQEEVFCRLVQSCYDSGISINELAEIACVAKSTVLRWASAETAPRNRVARVSIGAQFADCLRRKAEETMRKCNLSNGKIKTCDGNAEVVDFSDYRAVTGIRNGIYGANNNCS